MNVHHLELFYYVARHGGITEAVRNIPYGIQQPAVSGQVAQLEEYLGVSLFQRRPFALTPAGEKLYSFIAPFFSNLDAISSELRGGEAHHIRIGASTIVLRDHLPELLCVVRKRYRDLTVSLCEGYQAELETLLQKAELDLVVTPLEGKPAPGLRSLALLELPLALVVRKEHPLAAVEDLWNMDRIDQPLICLPAIEAVSRHFQQGIARLGVDWVPSIEVSSIDLILIYVRNGFGVGLSVLVPRSQLPPDTRALPLPASQFAPVVLGALWRGRPSPLLQAVLDEMKVRAEQMTGRAAETAPRTGRVS